MPTAEKPSDFPSATIFSTVLVDEFSLAGSRFEMMADIDSIVETSAFLADEAATLAFAARFAQSLRAPLSIALHGDLGAGKTTFVRGLLRELGVTGAIKSPTYALVETYDTSLGEVHHMDAYRIEGRADFEARGGLAYFEQTSIRLVEWPEKIDRVVRFDLAVRLDFEGNGRRISLTKVTIDPTKIIANYLSFEQS
jgi:tRNA threonylcarbamoyladenosine biosynthesis protein TsaE